MSDRCSPLNGGVRFVKSSPLTFQGAPLDPFFLSYFLFWNASFRASGGGSFRREMGTLPKGVKMFEEEKGDTRRDSYRSLHEDEVENLLSAVLEMQGNLGMGLRRHRGLVIDCK
ncbi:hypothetical protein AVEN_151683-1 [Araneus ventricosus]|uniref:Uncharacterized protein n=1 Tax=Araneus ventricosus TaxID=182803 RepID=A0A4Y2R6H9_ARAVE|nr:hypothetical protein AVEN_151683-1 [Araneus ventricosus]